MPAMHRAAPFSLQFKCEISFNKFNLWWSPSPCYLVQGVQNVCVHQAPTIHYPISPMSKLTKINSHHRRCPYQRGNFAFGKSAKQTEKNRKTNFFQKVFFPFSYFHMHTYIFIGVASCEMPPSPLPLLPTSGEPSISLSLSWFVRNVDFAHN